MTDEEIWTWVIGGESPRVVASEFRDRGVLNNESVAHELLEVRGWMLLLGVVFENGLTVADIKASVKRTLLDVAWMPDYENMALVRHFERQDPRPAWSWLPACKQAIEAAIDGDLDRLLPLPPYREHETATAREILERFNLNPSGVFTLSE